MYNHQFMSTSKQLPVVVQSEGIVLTEITILVAFQMAMELLALSDSLFTSLCLYIYIFSLYLIFSINSIILERSNILLYNMEASNNQQEQNQSHTFQLVSQVPSFQLPSIMTTLAASVAQQHLKVIRNEWDIDGHHLDQQISSQVSELQKQMKNSFLGLVKKVSQGAAQVQEQIECLQNVCKLLQFTSGKSQQNSIYAQVYIQTEAYKCKLKQVLAWIEGYIKIVNNPSESNENLPKIIQIFVQALHEDKFNLSNQSNYYLTRLLINKIFKFNGSFIRSWSIQKASFQQNNKFQVLFLIRQRISFLKSKIRNQRQLDDDSGQAEQKNKMQLQQQKLPSNSNNAEQVQDLPVIIQDPMEQLKQRNMRPGQGSQPNNEILDQHSHKNDSLDLSMSRNDGDKKEYQEQAKEMDSFEYQISQSLANRLSSKQDNWNSIHDFLDKPNNESPLPPLADPSSSGHQLESLLDKNNRIQYRNIKLIEQAPQIELKKQNKIREKHEWHGPQIADSSPSPFQLQNQMYMSENKREMENDDNFCKDSGENENEHVIEYDQQEGNRNKQKCVKQARLISRRKQAKNREKEQQINRKITRSSNRNVGLKDMKRCQAVAKDGRKQITDINTPLKTTKTKKLLIQTLIDKSQQVQRIKKQKYLKKIRKLFYLLKSKYQITLHQYVDVCEEIHKLLVWFMKGFIRKLLMVAKMRNRRYTGQHYGDQFRYFSESNNNLCSDLIKNPNIFSQLNTNDQALDQKYGHDIRQSAQNFEPQPNLYKVCYPSKLESYQRIKIGEISQQDKLYERIHAFDLEDNQGANKKVQIQKLKKNEFVMAKYLVDGYHKEKIEFQKEENGLPTGRLIITTNMIVDVALADWDWIAMPDIGFYRGL